MRVVSAAYRRRPVIGLCVAVVVATQTGCMRAGASTSGYDVIHPTAENVPADDQLSAIVSSRKTPVDTRAAALMTALRNATEVSRFGTVGPADRPDVFSEIAAIALGADSTVFVADARMNEIRAFDSSGSARTVASKVPSASTRFRALTGLEWLSSDTLVVGDRSVDRTLRLAALRRRPGGFDLARSIPLPFGPESFCAAEGQLFVRGWVEDGTTIHRYSATGVLEHSFGSGYRSPSRLVREQLSDGVIACVAGSPIRVVEMLESWPYLYGYDAADTRRWISKLEDFTPQIIKSGMSPRGRPSVLREGRVAYDVPKALLAIPGTSFVLLQVGRREPATMKLSRELKSYLIDAGTGEGWLVGSQLPRLFAISGRTLAGAVDEPHPAVVLYRLSEKGESGHEK